MEQLWENNGNRDQDDNVSASGSSGGNPSHSSDSANRNTNITNRNTNMRNAQVSANQFSPSAPNGSNRLSVYKTVICIKLTYKMSLIIASTIMLIAFRQERSHNPLLLWIAGSVAGHLLSLPSIFRHYFLPYPRLYKLVDSFYWLLELFFALWFLVGNYWVLKESSSTKAQNLYRCCITLLVFDYIKYVGPCIFRVMLLCCRDVLKQNGGAHVESINALRTYKFQLLKNEGVKDGDVDGGIVAAGTERERTLTRDDAICCICLSSYNDNDDLKELPCCHLFHINCIDTWLKIKAFCPLCKCAVGECSEQPVFASTSNQQV